MRMAALLKRRVSTNIGGTEEDNMIVVIGGSGCGKSSYAEGRIQESAERDKQKRYYLATMMAFGEEGKKKIRRHRQQRIGKGMITIEQPVNISEALLQMETGEPVSALLEDVGNLVANEMFADPAQRKEADEVAEKILRELLELDRKLSHFVIVTNNVFEDGILYNEGTMEYIRALGGVNAGLAKAATELVELVVGIPVFIKGEGRTE